MKGVLNEFIIYQKTRMSNLSDIKSLNMWGLDLVDVSIVERMSNLERATFSLNSIKTLSSFSKCTKLYQLHLRHNMIAEFSELQYLQTLPQLKELTLTENPICELPDYVQRVRQMLPNLSVLDKVQLKQEESNNIFINMENNPRNHVLRQSDISNFPKNRGCMKTGFVALPLQNKRSDKSEKKISRDDVEQSMLNAILSLIPKMSTSSLHIVQEEIKARSPLRI